MEEENGRKYFLMNYDDIILFTYPKYFYDYLFGEFTIYGFFFILFFFFLSKLKVREIFQKKEYSYFDVTDV